MKLGKLRFPHRQFGRGKEANTDTVEQGSDQPPLNGGTEGEQCYAANHQRDHNEQHVARQLPFLREILDPLLLNFDHELIEQVLRSTYRRPNPLWGEH